MDAGVGRAPAHRAAPKRRRRADEHRANQSGVGDVSPRPRISFGIIVFNGEPFTRYCLRALYPHAFEIIVVEGGHEGTVEVATPDGHSTDGTLEAIRSFVARKTPSTRSGW